MAGKGVKALFLDPIYYKDQPYKVAPGVLDLVTSDYGMSLNVITFFEKKDATYHFQKGDPICMFYFPNRIHLKKRSKMAEYDHKKFLLDYEDM